MDTNKQRHGFTTFWFVLMAIGVALTIFAFFGAAAAGVKPNYFLGGLIACQSGAVLNLFWWKKVGFFQYVSAVVIKAFYLGVVGLLDPVSFFVFTLDILALWGVLQLKGENGKTCWEQLEILGVPKKD